MIKVAMLWLVNEDGELLLARRADHKKQDPGLWGPSVTGKLEAGETPEEALFRETEEELGLHPDKYIPNFLFETDYIHPDGETRHFSIYYTKTSKDIINSLDVDRNEVAEVAWMSTDKIQELLRTRPGETVVASAFVLWERILGVLEKNTSTL